MRLVKYRFHLVIFVFAIAVLGLSRCATEAEEKVQFFLLPIRGRLEM